MDQSPFFKLRTSVSICAYCSGLSIGPTERIKFSSPAGSNCPACFWARAVSNSSRFNSSALFPWFCSTVFRIYACWSLSSFPGSIKGTGPFLLLVSRYFFAIGYASFFYWYAMPPCFGCFHAHAWKTRIGYKQGGMCYVCIALQSPAGAGAGKRPGG